MLGVGRKSERLLLALTLLLLTPYLATAVQPIMNEYVLAFPDPISEYTPTQFEEMGPINIESAEEFESYGFPGDGSESNPYVIEGANISSLVSCITISNVNVSFVIRNGIFESTRILNPVIYLWNAENGIIENCVIFGGNEGILGSVTRNLRILGNTICDSGSGLRLINSRNVTAIENTIYGHSMGVELVFTSESFFSTNRIYSNRHRGFNVDASSEFNTFTSNVIGWNDLDTAASRNAADAGSNNTWFSNMWSDYIPPGTYNISGDSQSEDILPIVLFDNEAPRINSPEDVVMGEGSEVTVAWSPIDAFPHLYQLQINAEIIADGVWLNQDFSIDLQSLEPGDYNLIFTVIDGSGNSTEDLVYASVLFVILGDVGTALVAYASTLSVVLFLVVLCLFKQRP